MSICGKMIEENMTFVGIQIIDYYSAIKIIVECSI